MATEIERKFLVTGDGWRANSSATPYRQGYLSTEVERNVRVRLKGDKATLTVKGKARGAEGITRLEYQYDIPTEDATALLELCEKPLIEKVRHKLDVGGLEWVIDEFSGDNAGLIVAEVELESEDQPFERPSWIGEEVSHDTRYLNANLVSHPYKDW